MYTIRGFVIQFLNILLAIISFFLLLRIIFEVFSANAGTPFVAWIYAVSNTFLGLFRGMFASFNLNPLGVFDTTAALALLLYILLFSLIIALVNALISSTHTHYIDHEHDHHH